MMRLRGTARLVGEVLLYAKVNRAWWVLPVFFCLLFAMLVIVVGQAAAPFTIYTLF